MILVLVSRTAQFILSNVGSVVLNCSHVNLKVGWFDAQCSLLQLFVLLVVTA